MDFWQYALCYIQYTVRLHVIHPCAVCVFPGHHAVTYCEDANGIHGLRPQANVTMRRPYKCRVHGIMAMRTELAPDLACWLPSSWS